jgi:RNA polymerase sigma-70 factor, ECF subfamily
MDRSAVADQSTVGEEGTLGQEGTGERNDAEASLLELARAGDQGAFAALVEPRRGELRSYCYRMLGSVQDADDAVQNTLLRAWRGLAAFEGRSSVRSWLYSIATNNALDIAKHRSRRELPTGFGPAGSPGDALDSAVTDPVWLEPYPDRWLPDAGPASPEARYELRESVELAFLIMLQRLPPLQRAVLILRDVLGFPAAEAAAQLGTSTAAVNSALQRARAAARAEQPDRSQQAVLRTLGEQGMARLARRYADAIEAGDVETLIGMLTQDATWCMPPIPTWFRGHDTLRQWLVRDPLPLRWRHRPTMANGQLAVGGYLYHPDAGDFVPHVVDVLTLSSGAEIAAVTAFFAPQGSDPADFFAAFGLPAQAPTS